MDAHVVGGAIGVLGTLGMLGAIVTFLGGTALTGVGPWALMSVALARGLGAAIAAYGGHRMYQADDGGKPFAIYGLLIYVVTGLPFLMAAPINELSELAAAAVLYYLVGISRFLPQRPPS